MIVAVVDDLMFSSRIREAARAAGAEVTFVRRRADVDAALGAHRPGLVLFDLDRDALDPIGAIREIRGTPEFSGVTVVAFGSHVKTERLQAAREAGADRVMARSAFVAELPKLLAAATASSGAAGESGEPDGAADRSPDPTAADVAAAARRIAGRVWRTPLLESAWLSDAAGAPVWLKLESVQRTGSFKIRGATNSIARLREERPDVRAVTTASAGNHGVALATAAREFGIAARVHLPATAPAVKKDALRRLGADVVEAPTYDAAEEAVRAEIARGGATFVSAYSHPDVISGAGTVGVEMIDDLPELDAFIVPLGGGGLLSGIALAVRARRPNALIVGAEAARSPVFTSALAAGRPVNVDVQPTVADGLAGNMEPDSRTFPLVRDLVDRVIAVPEQAIVDAMRALLVHARLYVEGAAATAVAAALSTALPLAGRKVAVVLSGRNGDGSVFHRFPQ
jgi:threonine dehydratase